MLPYRKHAAKYKPSATSRRCAANLKRNANFRRACTQTRNNCFRTANNFQSCVLAKKAEKRRPGKCNTRPPPRSSASNRLQGKRKPSLQTAFLPQTMSYHAANNTARWADLGEIRPSGSNMNCGTLTNTSYYDVERSGLSNQGGVVGALRVHALRLFIGHSRTRVSGDVLTARISSFVIVLCAQRRHKSRRRRRPGTVCAGFMCLVVGGFQCPP